MKKPWISFCLLLAALLLTACSQAAGIEVNGTQYSTDLTTLDASDWDQVDVAALAQFSRLESLKLRGSQITPEEYRQLQQALPDCRIQWDIPFQGNVYSQDTTHLTISQLTQGDIDALCLFPNLAIVDATACRDHEAVVALRAALPAVQVPWHLTLGGDVYAEDTKTLILQDVSPEDLTLALECLPELSGVTLTGRLPEGEFLAHAAKEYPQTAWHWEYPLFDRVLTPELTELDLSGIPMADTQAVEAALNYLPRLEKLILCDCGIPSEDMAAMAQRHPQVRFVWTVSVGRCRIRTDATTFMPLDWDYRPGAGLKDEDCLELKYCTDMVCMDLGHMDITDCSFVAEMPNLEYLILGDSKVKDLSPLAGLKKLKYLEIFLTQVTDISALAGCTALEDVNMSWLALEDVSALAGLENLKNVWLISAYYPRDEMQAIVDSHPDTVFMRIYATSSTGNGWRRTENYYAMRDLLGMPYMDG